MSGKGLRDFLMKAKEIKAVLWISIFFVITYNIDAGWFGWWNKKKQGLSLQRQWNVAKRRPSMEKMRSDYDKAQKQLRQQRLEELEQEDARQESLMADKKETHAKIVEEKFHVEKSQFIVECKDSNLLLTEEQYNALIENSSVIKNVVMDIQEEKVIPLTDINSSTIKIIVYLLTRKNLSIGQGDDIFFSSSLPEMVSIINACDYLDIQKILDLATAYFAEKIAVAIKLMQRGSSRSHFFGILEDGLDSLINIVDDVFGSRIVRDQITQKLLGHLIVVVPLKPWVPSEGSVVLSPNGKYVAIAHNNTMKILDIIRNEIIKNFHLDKDCIGMVFNQHSTLFATIDNKTRITVWNIQTKEQNSFSFLLKGDNYRIQFDPFSDLLLVSCQRLNQPFNIMTLFAPFEKMNNHLLFKSSRDENENPIWRFNQTAIKYGSSGYILLLNAQDAKGVLLDLKKYTSSVSNLKIEYSNIVDGDFSLNGKYLGIIGNDGSLYVKDLESEKVILSIKDRTYKKIISFIDDTRAMLIKGENDVVVLDIISGTEDICGIGPHEEFLIDPSKKFVYGITHAEGKKTAEAWDIQNNTFIKTYEAQDLFWGLDGNCVITKNYNNEVSVFNQSSGRLLMTYPKVIALWYNSSGASFIMRTNKDFIVDVSFLIKDADLEQVILLLAFNEFLQHKQPMKISPTKKEEIMDSFEPLIRKFLQDKFRELQATNK